MALLAQDVLLERGRYAPSPTGELHLGNVRTALLAWLDVRARGGSLILRIDDLDQARCRPELRPRQLDELRWLGLDWEEGPDRGGPCAPYVQSERAALYLSAREKLRAAGRIYPCFCSRQDLQHAGGAPHPEEESEPPYPGHCRDLPPLVARDRINAGEAHAWRFKAPEGEQRITDDLLGVYGQDLSRSGGDFVVWRKENLAAYQLACAVDEIAMGITRVVRGADLALSTLRQMLLIKTLGGVPPVYVHVPLLFDHFGRRFSKRTGAVSLSRLREDGVAPGEVLHVLAHTIGMKFETPPAAPWELLAQFGGLKELKIAARLEPGVLGGRLDNAARNS